MKWLWIGAVAAAVAAAGCGTETTTPTADAGSATARESAPSPADGVAPDASARETSATAAPTRPAKVPPTQYRKTASGLKYAILAPGRGEAAGEHQTVAVHYTGWLENGTKFDSSLDRGKPIEFALGHGQVIPGWEEGIRGMKVGEKRQLVIPPALAYGDSGTPGGPIPPKATLIFDVELVRVGEAHRH